MAAITASQLTARQTPALKRSSSRATRRCAAVVPVRAETPSWGPASCHGGAHLSAERKAELERVALLIGTPGKLSPYPQVNE